eukprot:GFUD01011209.1.p1 GENE.GFUD01011209.1~~GFUD01011209.1.p1  ORF type:complete len:398 (+),score=108.83 GFUD01011209.1:222-1415(+)
MPSAHPRSPQVLPDPLKHLSQLVFTPGHLPRALWSVYVNLSNWKLSTKYRVSKVSRVMMATMISPYLRYLVLTILVLQTSFLVLTLRYSRTHSNGEPYIATTVVFLTECLKYFLCLVLLLWQKDGSLKCMINEFRHEIILRPMDTVMLAIPASLYTLQNNLLILALTNLDAATYQVTYQLKILTTAGFSVLLLGKQLDSKQWVSLLLLMGGVALVQMPTMASSPLLSAQEQQDQLIGFVAVLTACFSSGFAGVFYEKLVKQSSQPSVIIRNLQLGIFSLIFSSSAMAYYNSSDISTLGMFYGYTSPVIAVICLQACGGLVVAATIKYADNILKGFATSISIIVSTLCSWFVLEDLQPGSQFLAGTAIVLAASLLYGLPLAELCKPGKSAAKKTVLSV